MGRTVAGVAVLLGVLPALAQYLGQVTEKTKDEPALRAVAVLEWTGPAGKPHASRLVPITIYDGEALQDAGIYLARPEPLAIYGGVEYILEKDGRHVGLFDLHSAGQQDGTWLGFGSWKAMPKPKSASDAKVGKIDEDDEYSDRPVLHRKHHGADASGKDSASSPASNGPPVDPDRPTLHKPADESASASAGGDGGAASDPDRPKLNKSRPQKAAADVGSVESLPDVTDPDRPRLLRGKYTAGGPPVAPSLLGLPAETQQMVAVSDPRNRPEHPWDYKWANPDDQSKMKADLETIARAALGLNTQPAAASPAKAAKAKSTPHGKAAPQPQQPDEEAASLHDEQFRVFELAYGAGATMVLTAHTDGPLIHQKFVTLIGQPDLYGNVIVLMKSVTDGAHLDETPRMKLIDAVDVLGDNRGEILFELRSLSQRQFALYRVLRGSAEKLFVTGGADVGIAAAN
ncbi:MAG: hypothetical protein KGJ51_10960 [Acidobacteriota bacterium]|nr:hypothetical protein [Acidobacteriota bacterium]MDE3187547.1 hypothetical protein [Acidobacteriota bacterium]